MLPLFQKGATRCNREPERAAGDNDQTGRRQGVWGQMSTKKAISLRRRVASQSPCNQSGHAGEAAKARLMAMSRSLQRESLNQGSSNVYQNQAPVSPNFGILSSCATI